MTIEQPIRPFLSTSGSHWPIHDMENVTLVCRGLSWSLPQDDEIRYDYFWFINGTRYDPVKEQLPAGHQVPADSKGNELVVTDVTIADNGRVYSCMTSEDGSTLESPVSNTVTLPVWGEFEKTLQVLTTHSGEVFTTDKNARSSTETASKWRFGRSLGWMLGLNLYAACPACRRNFIRYYSTYAGMFDQRIINHKSACRGVYLQ